MALAVAALHERQVARIILTRPAVEAGERLGFLPGDMLAKVDPYLRPLFDALYDMLDPDKTCSPCPGRACRRAHRHTVDLGESMSPRKEAEPLTTSTAGRVRMIRATWRSCSAATARAVARVGTPVPAGPMPKVTVQRRIASQ